MASTCSNNHERDQKDNLIKRETSVLRILRGTVVRSHMIVMEEYVRCETRQREGGLKRIFLLVALGRTRMLVSISNCQWSELDINVPKIVTMFYIKPRVRSNRVLHKH